MTATAAPPRRQSPARPRKSVDLPVDKLRPDPENRPDGSGKEGLHALAETIKAVGILHDLVVAPHPGRPGFYLIRAGERRWRAAQLVPLQVVPCVIRPDLAGGGHAALVRVIENCHRVDHGPVELALAFGKLLREGMTQADIARWTGMSPATISYHVELLDADEQTLNRVRRGELPAGAVHDAVREFRAASPGRPSGSASRSTGSAGRSSRSRQASGSRPVPPYFTATHPLASAAYERCTTAGHAAATRARYGKVACGACWEAAIRADALAGGGRPLTQPVRLASQVA